jgi:hypothetical protein
MFATGQIKFLIYHQQESRKLRSLRILNPTGLYLYGSLAAGDFDPKNSDIDLMAATVSEVSDQQFERLQQMRTDKLCNPEWFACLEEPASDSRSPSAPSLENPLHETRTSVVRRCAHSLPRGSAAPRGESFRRWSLADPKIRRAECD